MTRPELELLAPARDADIGIEAVNHGADAVYIGGPAFGARDKAGNDVRDIARLAAHAHRFGARIFVTLNTILRDDELEPARRLAWDVWNAGADALIVQDMGLLELDLPPIPLHASTQCDIRTPAKARFLQDVGFSQLVLARELTLEQVRAVSAQVREATLEFFVHGALCVAYSGQCAISHALNGRSANRGNCSQECRQAYTVRDGEGRIVAHDKHVLSLKDNDQSANLAALVDAGIRSFKIEGRYKDLGYVKNVTGHYRRLLDAVLHERPALSAASSGRTRLLFTPDPARNFNRGATDYFVHGRQIDIGAFDTPKHAGLPVGHVVGVAADHFVLEACSPDIALNNGDALTWVDLQGELQGVPVNVARALGMQRWRVEPSAPTVQLKDLRRGTAVSRNRDAAWERLLARPTAERRIGVRLRWSATDDGFALDITDADGHRARVQAPHAHQPVRADAGRAADALREQLRRLGGTRFEAIEIVVDPAAAAWFVPAALANRLRREAVHALEAQRTAAWRRLPRALPVQPPVPYPEQTLTYLANVHNAMAARFYARHGVKIIESAYESHEHTGDVSLMITRHCVRYSLSLCPKQAKGVIGVQGTVRAEPLTLTHGDSTYTLRFDCKACEMHVVGRIRKAVLREAQAQPLTFYRQRPTDPGGVRFRGKAHAS